MNKNMKELIKKIVPASTIAFVRDFLSKRELKKISKIKKAGFKNDEFPFGINLIAPITQDSGLGHSSRIVARAIKDSGIPFTIVSFIVSKDISHTDIEFQNYISDEIKYGINLWHINMHEFAKAFEVYGIDKFDRHYNIAYWLWEMQRFPEMWRNLFNVLDEIWVPSEFTGKSILNAGFANVHTIAYSIDSAYNEELDRKYFELPEDMFLFLMMFDKNSMMERKNPYAVIEAFKSAFKAEENVGLIVKINNISKDELNEIKKHLYGYKVFFINKILPKKDVNALIKLADVYVSLHRAEGFGLVLAEAMRFGTPTIATNYSSNTEFQNKKNACLVNYELKEVGENKSLYKKDDIWAEPNVKEAANYMKRLYNDKSYYNYIKENAMEYITQNLNIEKQKRLITQRVYEIYQRKEYENVK
jgi:glycosyltransferase, family 1